MQIESVAPRARLSTKERVKLQRTLDKLRRIFHGRDGLRAHATLSKQRHLCEAEVTLRVLRHTLVVAGRGPSEFAALQMAFERLEKQAVRNKRKIIDTQRPGRQRDRPSPVIAASMEPIPAAVSAEQGVPTGPVIRSARTESKPMTAEGALLALEDRSRDYIAYRDLDTDRIHVLIRRQDGDVDLVEGA